MSDLAPGQADPIFRAIAEAADNARLGVTVTAHDGDEVEVLFMNAAMAELLGTTEEVFRERGVWSFIAPDQLPRILDMHGARRTGGTFPRVFTTAMLRTDGERFPVEISTSGVTLAGRPANVTFVSDISALSQSEERFRRLVEGAPDGVVILRWPTILFINREATRMLGLSEPAEAVGKRLTDYLEPAEVPEAEARARGAMEGEARRAPAEYTGHDPDGTRLTVEVSAIPIEYEGAPAVLAFSRDVTERKAVFAKLARADKLAAVGTLAAGVAHEVNNPLGYLLLNLEFLRRELPRLGGDPARTEAMLMRLEDARHGAERVKTIVRDLQAFTRKDENIRGPVDLAAVIVAATQLARHQLGSTTRVTHSFDALPPAHGNDTRLEQLILNLLINAAQAIEETGREDGEIHVVATRGDPGQLVVRVSDNGAGMTPDHQAHVFEPFFTTKPPGVGTGLGLPICHGIARAVGGDLQLESTPGEGTTVTVVLRVHDDTTPTSAQRAAPSPARGTGRRARLLLIDDERAVMASLSAALEDHEVVCCSSAQEARDVLDRDDEFDVIVCDLMLRQESGMDVYRYATEQQPALSERFIFMTGGAYRPEAQKFLDQVGRPQLEKPFELSALRQLVEDLLR